MQLFKVGVVLLLDGADLRLVAVLGVGVGLELSDALLHVLHLRLAAGAELGLVLGHAVHLGHERAQDAEDRRVLRRLERVELGRLVDDARVVLDGLGRGCLILVQARQQRVVPRGHLRERRLLLRDLPLERGDLALVRLRAAHPRLLGGRKRLLHARQIRG